MDQKEIPGGHRVNKDQQRAYDQAQLLMAFSQGRAVEFFNPRSGKWEEITGKDISLLLYRIKPEPREVIAWEKDGRLYFPEHHFPETEWSEDGYRKILLREVIE